MMNDLTLVTGATGFIGRYVVRQLLQEDELVRVLVRDPCALEPAARDRVQIVQGDIRDGRSVAAAVQGVDRIIHLAACARAWSRDPTEFETVNVDAVERLLDAAHCAQVQRLVHVSTIVTLTPHRAAPVTDRYKTPTPYEATKVAGERLVEAYAASGRHAVIVHPTRVYGPGPLTDANGVSKLFALYLRGRFRFRLDDKDVLGNYVHAGDVAAGILLAARRARSGAHYILGGPENASIADLLRLLDELAGVHHLVLRLPKRAAFAYAHAAELWGHLGGSVILTPGWVRTFLEDHRVDIGPARREIGYRPRSLRQGTAETIAWLRRAGHVKGRRVQDARWIASLDPRVS
jgi:farnesol dehydrogenase